MRNWFAYTGSHLIQGRGRTIYRLLPNTADTDSLRTTAMEMARATQPSVAVAADIFIAALMAPLAAQEFASTANPTVFSNTRQVLALFDHLAIELVAIHFLNGKTASAYVEEGNIQAITARVMRGFERGELLTLPRDRARLYQRETMRELPGVVMFLLAQALAEKKAFEHYLRRGTAPIITPETKAHIATERKVLRTWEREARIAREQRNHQCEGGH